MDNQKATQQFYAIVWPHRATVLRVARILTRGDAEADDLAQETLLKAFKAIERFQEGTNITAWLLAILRNTRIDRLRSGAASSANVSLNQLDLDPADRSIAQERWQNPQEVLNAFSDQQVIDALKDLPEEIRWTLLLVDVEGWDQKLAAEMLEVPVGTIKSRLHRGRAMLREALSPLARQLRMVRE